VLNVNCMNGWGRYGGLRTALRTYIHLMPC
jgi:hypothetical protein